MSPLMVTLPPFKGLSPPDGGVSTTIVEPFSAGANWMFHVPGLLFVALIASSIEIPSGPGLAVSAFTDDVSPFTTTVAFCDRDNRAAIENHGRNGHGWRCEAFRANRSAIGRQGVRSRKRCPGEE